MTRTEGEKKGSSSYLDSCTETTILVRRMRQICKGLSTKSLLCRFDLSKLWMKVRGNLVFREGEHYFPSAESFLKVVFVRIEISQWSISNRRKQLPR